MARRTLSIDQALNCVLRAIHVHVEEDWPRLYQILGGIGGPELLVNDHGCAVSTLALVTLACDLAYARDHMPADIADKIITSTRGRFQFEEADKLFTIVLNATLNDKSDRTYFDVAAQFFLLNIFDPKKGVVGRWEDGFFVFNGRLVTELSSRLARAQGAGFKRLYDDGMLGPRRYSPEAEMREPPVVRTHQPLKLSPRVEPILKQNPLADHCGPAFPTAQSGDIAQGAFFRVWGILRADGTWLWRRAPYKFKHLSANRAQKALQFVVPLRLNDPNDTQRLLAFLEKYPKSRRMTELAFRALSYGNLRAFGPLPIMPDVEGPNTRQAFDIQWESLKAQARTGDLIFTRPTNNRLSQFIARLDQGSWSHIVYCGHDGFILDVNTNGTKLVTIDKLYDRQLRMGLYRYCDAIRKQMDYEWSLKRLSDYLSPKTWYSYRKVIGFVPRAVFKWDTPTPNGLIYRGILYPLVLI